MYINILISRLFYLRREYLILSESGDELNFSIKLLNEWFKPLNFYCIYYGRFAVFKIGQVYTAKRQVKVIYKL